MTDLSWTLRSVAVKPHICFKTMALPASEGSNAALHPHRIGARVGNGLVTR